MENELKFKSSIIYTLIRISLIFLLLASIACMVLGIFDFRSEAQKEKDAYTELVTSTAFTESVKAVRFIQNHTLYDVVEIVKVSYTKFSEPLILVVFKNSFNEEQNLTYIIETKSCVLGDYMFRTASRPFREQVVTYENDDLAILLMEAI